MRHNPFRIDALIYIWSDCRFAREKRGCGNISLDEIDTPPAIPDAFIRTLQPKAGNVLMQSRGMVQSAQTSTASHSNRRIPLERPMANVLSSAHSRLLEGLNLLVEVDRLKSFSSWPSMPPRSTARSMARAGFFYLGNLDRTQCFSCGGVWRNWRGNDDPLTEHRRHLSHCKMARGLETLNVKDDTSLPPQVSTSSHERFSLSSEEKRNLQLMFPCEQPVTPHVKALHLRVETFKHWTFTNATDYSIAAAGFFRTSYLCMSNWQRNDDPWEEHAKWYPTCEFLLQMKGPDYVHSVVARFPDLNRPILQSPGNDVPPPTQNQRMANTSGGCSAPEIIDPQREVLKLLDDAMKSEVTEIVVGMGFEEKIVEAVMKSHIQEHGKSYETATALLDAVLSYDEEEAMDTEESTSTCTTIRRIDKFNKEMMQSAQTSTASHSNRRIPLERPMANVLSSVHSRLLERLNLLVEVDRLKSFSSWPSMPPRPTARSMARAGFFYLGNLDRTQCFSCGGVWRNWRGNDDPLTEHRRHFSHCKMARGLETLNVKDDTSLPPQVSTSSHERFSLSSEERRNLQLMFPCEQPVTPHMKALHLRVETFKHWTFTNATDYSIAVAGFFSLNVRDRVKCFHCNGGLQNWLRNDDPWEEHAKWYPTCEFLLQMKGPDYVHSLVARFPDLNRPILPSRGNDVPPPTQNQRMASTSGGFSAPEIIDPQREVLKLLDDAMKSEVTEIVVGMGFEENIVRAVMKSHIQEHGEPYETATALLDAVMSYDEEEAMDTEESTSTCTTIRRIDVDDVTNGNSDDPMEVEETIMQHTQVDDVTNGNSDDPMEVEETIMQHTQVSTSSHERFSLSSEERRNLQLMFPCEQPVTPDMKALHLRVETFKHWTFTNATEYSIAVAGFFSLNEGERVKCFYCNGGLQNWQRNDDPWEEHAKWFPTCEFLLQMKGPDYVHSVVARFPDLARPVLEIRGHDVPPPTQNQRMANTSRGCSAPESIDPQREVLKLLDDAMKSEITEIVVGMGFEEKIVRALMKSHIQEHGKPYETTTALLEAVMESAKMKSSEYLEMKPSQCVEIKSLESVEKMELEKLRKDNEKLTKQLEQFIDEHLCKVCFDKPADAVFIPCGHICCCLSCTQALRKCPICREKIERAVRTYTS